MVIQVNPIILRKIADAMDEGNNGCRCRFVDINKQTVEFCRDDTLECPETMMGEINRHIENVENVEKVEKEIEKEKVGDNGFNFCASNNGMPCIRYRGILERAIRGE